MALDLEDQEQLDEFKAWWNKNGKLTITLVLSAIIAYAAWQGYEYMQHKKGVEASDLYQSMLQLDVTKMDLVKEKATKLKADYQATPYAGRAAVFLAKGNFATDDLDGAKAELEWAIKNAQEAPIQAVASLQLATLHLEAKDYKGAEQLLAADIDQGYIGLKDALLGDVYLAQGKTDEAKKVYESALANLDAEGALRLMTQQKLDSLGS